MKFGEVVRLNKETCKDPAADAIERVIGLEHLEPGELRVHSWASVAEGTTFTNRVRPRMLLFGERRAYQRKVAVATSTRSAGATSSCSRAPTPRQPHDVLVEAAVPDRADADSGHGAAPRALAWRSARDEFSRMRARKHALATSSPSSAICVPAPGAS